MPTSGGTGFKIMPHGFIEKYGAGRLTFAKRSDEYLDDGIDVPACRNNHRTM